MIKVQELIQFFTGGNVDAAHTHGSDNPTDDMRLCNYHYMQWYRHTHTSQTKCITYGKTFQKYSTSRLVPEPALLQQFLTTNTEFKDIIHKDDRVCYVCLLQISSCDRKTHQKLRSTDTEYQVLNTVG